jgi:asparagine synthase (glutamine-hydrolysing)
MCGISGKLYFDRDRVVDPEVIRRMSAALAHRGPDGGDIYVKGPVGLGHRRLAIIDLSEDARQPMANEDGSVMITFNGEIYNFLELRKELEGNRHVFRCRSDTEVIIHLYEEMGPECVKRLRGMFAFAIWDENKQRLLLARDRAGEKPLYYYRDSDQLIFGSEIVALLQDRSIPVQPDPEAVWQYLHLRFIPSPLSGFQAIRKLPAAHYLMVENGKVHIERYWALDYSTKVHASIREEELSEMLLAELREAVRMRLISDVPLGAFLSGGIDSSAVVALMAQCVDTPVKTFSISFGEKAYNEAPFARLMARRLGTDHQEYEITPNAVEVLPKLVEHYGEPFADAAAIPTYYLSMLARKHVTVALSGDGGDENFAGYRHYRVFQRADVSNLLPSTARRFMKWVALRLRRNSPGSFSARAGRKLTILLEEGADRYVASVNVQEDWIGWLCTPEYLELVGAGQVLSGISMSQSGRLRNPLDEMLRMDTEILLPDNMLTKVDIASMANSLEVRAPMVDHHVMQLAASLPTKLKLKGRIGKHILRQAVRGLIPDEVTGRRKHGFDVPVGEWLRGDLKDLAYDLLLGKQLRDRGQLNAGHVRYLLDEHVKKRADVGWLLWRLLILELWYQWVDEFQCEGRIDKSPL